MQPNDLVENFTLQNQDGKDVSLTDFKGKPVVLFFYPRADTPGCTIESCGFRDAFTKFKKAGIVVLGISRDTVKAQKKFKDKYDLPYDLLADPDMILINRYDLIKPKNMYGKLVKGRKAHHLPHRSRPAPHPHLRRSEARRPRRRGPRPPEIPHEIAQSLLLLLFALRRFLRAELFFVAILTLSEVKW